MSSTKTIERRKAILRAKGVPERFVAALATRKAVGFRGLFEVIVILGFLLIAGSLQIAALDRAAPVLKEWLYGHIQPGLFFSPTVIFDYFSIIVMNCPFVLAIFGGMWLWSLFPEKVKPWPAYSATASNLRELGRNQTLKTTKPRPEYQQLGHLSSDIAFLETLIRNLPGYMFRATLRTTALLVCICGVLGLVAGQDYIRITDHQVEVHHAWGTRTFPLSEVKQAESQCSRIGKDSGFHYALNLPGAQIELYPSPNITKPGEHRDILFRLQGIDQRLALLNIPRVVVGPKGTTIGDYNGCLTDWRTKMKVNNLSFPSLAHQL